MKNKNRIRRGLYALFAIGVYLAGNFWVHDKIYTTQGYLVIPIIQASMDANWHVTIEDDRKQLIDFTLSPSELEPIIYSQKDYRPEQGRSEVKVTYQKNLWNKVIDPRIHVVHPGWIRRPK